MPRKIIFFTVILLTSFSVSVSKVEAQNLTSSICDVSQEDSLYLYIRAVHCWANVDPRKALDTVRLYVEKHPYATTFPGEVTSAINHTIGFVNEFVPLYKSDWIDNYNWLIKMQPVNSEPSYQYTIFETLADNLSQIDLNEAANMYWNMTFIFPDTGAVSRIWKSIRSIRKYQKSMPQDTTPFHKLTFPLQPMPGGTNGISSSRNEGSTSLSVTPNPAKYEVKVIFSLPSKFFIKLSLYDILGREIQTVASGIEDEGKHTIPLSVADLSPSTYYLRMEYPGGVTTQKLVITR